MAPINIFEVGVWDGEAYNVDIVSNSNVSDFHIEPAQKTISFNVSGAEGMAGFCRIIIPNKIVQDMWQGNYAVLLNREPHLFRNWTAPTNTYIYLNYTHSEHQITIIPEFPSVLILPLLTIITFIAVVLLKKRRHSSQQ